MSRVPRLGRVLWEEVSGFSGRLWLLRLLESPIPVGAGGRLRALLYRNLGCQIGSGVLLGGPVTFGMGSSLNNLRIGVRCFLNSPLYVDAAAPVTLGDGVSLGHHVVIITTDHAVGPPEFRAGMVQAAPVTIGNGAWIAAGVTLLPGVTIGAGAVVAAGAVVTKDVLPNTLVGGVPARLIRPLDVEEEP